MIDLSSNSKIHNRYYKTHTMITLEAATMNGSKIFLQLLHKQLEKIGTHEIEIERRHKNTLLCNYKKDMVSDCQHLREQIKQVF